MVYQGGYFCQIAPVINHGFCHSIVGYGVTMVDQVFHTMASHGPQWLYNYGWSQLLTMAVDHD